MWPGILSSPSPSFLCVTKAKQATTKTNKQPPLATTRTKAADRAAPCPDPRRRSGQSPRSGPPAHLLVAGGGNRRRGVTSGGARVQLHGLRPRRRLHGVGGAGRRPRPAEGRQLQLACGCGCGGVVRLGVGEWERGGWWCGAATQPAVLLTGRPLSALRGGLPPLAFALPCLCPCFALDS
jgi:hypothetical protein